MSRLKWITKRLAAGLAILMALLMIINVAYSWHTWRQLEQRLAKLRAAAEPTSFAELAPKPIPAKQDAAVHLQRLAPRLKAFEKEYAEFLDSSPLGKSYSDQERRGEQPTLEQITAIREIVSNFPDVPLEIDKASRCEGYASQVDYTVPDSLVIEEVMSAANGRRTPARFLRLKMTVLLAEGKQKEALKMGLVTLRLSRHFNAEPALVNGLVSIAIRQMALDGLNSALRAGPISTEIRHQLEQELAFHDNPAWVQHVMRTERVINLCASRSMFSRVRWLPWMARGVEVDILDYHQRLLPVISQPWHKLRDEIRNVNTNVSHSTPVSGMLTTLLTPSMEAASISFNRSTAMLRCLRTLNELTAFAHANGREAESLDDLTLPSAATLDPFSGKPLKLKWTDEGWVVYTVFKNGTDEGGDFEDQADWGLAPVGYER